MCVKQKTQKELLYYSGIGLIIFSIAIIIMGIIFKVFIPHQELGLSDYDAKEYIGGLLLIYGLFFLTVGILSLLAGKEGKIFRYIIKIIGYIMEHIYVVVHNYLLLFLFFLFQFFHLSV